MLRLQPSQPASASGGSGQDPDAASAPPPPPLRLAKVFGLPRDNAYFGSPDFAASALSAATQLLAEMARSLQKVPAFPELFQPAAAALEALAGVSAALPVSLAAAAGWALLRQVRQLMLCHSSTCTHPSRPSSLSHQAAALVWEQQTILPFVLTLFIVHPLV